MDNGNNQEPASGLYTGPNEQSFKSNEVLPFNPEKQVPTDKNDEINFKDFNVVEKTVPTASHVAADGKRYYDKDLHYYPETDAYEPHKDAQEAPETASYMVATKKEAIDSNNIANKGFTGVISPEATKFLSTEELIAENARLREQNEELKNRLNNLEAKIDLLIASLQPANQTEAPAITTNLPSTPATETPAPVTETPVPGTETPKPEDLKLEQEKAKRDARKAAIIGGVVGATVGILGGAPVGIVGGIACMAVVAGGSKLAAWRYEALTSKINKAETPEEKAKLEKRKAVWEKIGKFIAKATPFLSGAAIGFGASAIASNLFLGGHGLLNMPHSVASGSTLSPSGTEKATTKIGNTSGSEVISPSGTETNFNSGLIQNGRVHLPGSAWDGNLATNPQSNMLTGGELNPANFSGGATNMGAFQLDKALSGAHYSVNQIMAIGDKAGMGGTRLVHQLLNAYQSNPSIDLNTAITNITGSGLSSW